MSETLLAILLATSSAKGSNVVFHWPPYPSSRPRLARPKPCYDHKQPPFDNVWLSATGLDQEGAERTSAIYYEHVLEDEDYEWTRPNPYIEHARSSGFSEAISKSHPNSRRASPSRDSSFERNAQRISGAGDTAYDQLLGFPTEFLASILCPKYGMCHQKFELTIEHLAFIGHPVCIDSTGSWTFEKTGDRGREARDNNGEEQNMESPMSPEVPTPVATSSSSPPHTFHLVFVIDRPDPSSSASGNLFKYFHVIYEQLAFTVTAVLFQEQVLHRFIDAECDLLNKLRESCISRDAPFSEYVAEALDGSSIARAMKTLYEAVRSNSIARLIINETGIEVQLPPKLDQLLHPEEEHPDFVEHSDPESISWGPELSFGWSLPSLAPWKSLLLYDMDQEQNELPVKLDTSQPGLSSKDQVVAEGLISFLETVSIFDSLAVIAHSLDWSLEREVYPAVRWLVYHRMAKVVDTVHRGLRTVLALSSKIEKSLPDLTIEFNKAFGHHPSIPTLPKLLASISNPSSQSPPASNSPPALTPNIQDNTSAPSLVPQVSTSTTAAVGPGFSTPTLDFFSAAVRSKDLVPVYQDVVIWLLRRDLVVILHVHVRIVATPTIKDRVRARRERAAKRRFEQRFVERGRKEGRRGSAGAVGNLQPGLFMRADSRRRFSNISMNGVAESGLTRSLRGYMDPVFGDERFRVMRAQRAPSPHDVRSTDRDPRSASVHDEAVDDDEDNEDEDDNDEDTWDEDRADDNSLPSIILEPGQATPLQRKWIAAMSEGKDREVAKRFKVINQYFDGKRSDDEIMHLAEITRKQLREVLQQYEEFLLTSLHPA